MIKYSRKEIKLMHVLKNILIVTAIVLLSVTMLMAALNAGFRLLYRDFYKNAERDFLIPGLNSGFVPQGFEDTESGLLISGYMKNKSPSRIYVAEKDGKNAKCVELYYADGRAYTAHAGGVDVWGDYVYLTGDATTEVFLLSDLMDGDGTATVIGEFDPGLDPAWCTVKDDYILMGSFANSASDDYPPEPTEILPTPAGDTNVSLIKVFKLDKAAPLGIDPKPVAAISTGEKVQGLSFIDDKNLVLSTSYGLGSSQLIFHKIEESNIIITYPDKSGDIPLIYLDSSTVTRTVKAPPMSEELVIRDGYVYIMNESACNKYLFGKFLGQYRCHKYKL